MQIKNIVALLPANAYLSDINDLRKFLNQPYDNPLNNLKSIFESTKRLKEGTGRKLDDPQDLIEIILYIRDMPANDRQVRVGYTLDFLTINPHLSLTDLFFQLGKFSNSEKREMVVEEAKRLMRGHPNLDETTLSVLSGLDSQNLTKRRMVIRKIENLIKNNSDITSHGLLNLIYHISLHHEDLSQELLNQVTLLMDILPRSYQHSFSFLSDERKMIEILKPFADNPEKMEHVVKCAQSLEELTQTKESNPYMKWEIIYRLILTLSRFIDEPQKMHIVQQAEEFIQYIKAKNEADFTPDIILLIIPFLEHMSRNNRPQVLNILKEILDIAPKINIFSLLMTVDEIRTEEAKPEILIDLKELLKIFPGMNVQNTIEALKNCCLTEIRKMIVENLKKLDLRSPQGKQSFEEIIERINGNSRSHFIRGRTLEEAKKNVYEKIIFPAI